TIFFLSFLTYSMFLQITGNANIISRATTAISIIEDSTLSIDKYEKLTPDKAYWNGRFYSDKAPGMTVLAIPAIAVIRLLFNILNIPAPIIDNGQLTHFFGVYVYFSTLLTSGLFTSIAAAMLFRTARRLAATQTGAVFGAFSYSLGTPAFGWA